MHKLYFIFSCAFLLSLGNTYSQDSIYFDRSWHETDRSHAYYYRFINEIEGDDLWEISDYYLASNKVQYNGVYSSLSPKIKVKTHIWYFENGEKEIEGHFVNNKRQGVWVYWYESGDTKKQGNFDDGFRSGEWVWWHDDGTLESKASYDKGEIQKERLWYYASGDVFREGHYTDGEKSGEWINYYDNGQKESIENYEKGLIEGTKISWYYNGKLKSQEVYEKGVLSGQSKFYDERGTLLDSKAVLDRRLNYNLLWEISGNGLAKSSYLMGTMHVKDPRAFKFSDSLISIFSGCEAFSMEIHPDSVFDFAYQETSDELLKHDYIAKTNARLGDYSDEWNPWIGSNIFGARNSWGRSVWVMNLNQLFHRDHKVYHGMPYFLDAYLYTKARSQGKVCAGQEDIKEHIQAGKDLPTYNKSLDILSRFDPSEEMIGVYEEGDIDKIRAFSNLLSSEEFNYRLLTIRNYKMADAVDSLIRLHSTFNTMGAAHLAGEEGVIEILKEKGYILRAVEVPVTSDQEIENGNKYEVNWEQFQDKRYGYEVTFPRKPILFEKKKELTYMAPDLVNEVSYISYALDLAFDESYNGKLTEDFIAKYFNRKLNKIGIEPIIRQKKKGFEIQYFKKTPRGTKVYYRYHVFTQDYNLYFIGVGALEKSGLMTRNADTFLESFKIIQSVRKREKLSWVEVIDSIGAIKFSIPENYQRKEIVKPSLYDYESIDLTIYQSFDTLTGNTFGLRFKNTTKDKEEYFNEIEDIYSSYFGYNYKVKNPFENGRAASREFLFTVHEEYYVLIKAIYRNKRSYLAIALIKDGNLSQAKEFVNKIDLVPQKVSKLSRCYFPNERFSVLLPTKDTIWDREYDFYISNWQKEREEELVEVFNKDVKTSELYSLDDSLNGINYQVRVRHFSKYAYIDLLDDYIIQEVHGGYGDDYRLVDSLFTEDQGPVYEYLFEKKEDGIFCKQRYLFVDTLLISLKVEYTKELDSIAPIQEFLTSYNIDSLDHSSFINERKTSLLIKGLSDPDIVERAEARGALSFYKVRKEELPLVYEAYRILPDDLDSAIRRKVVDAFVDIIAQQSDDRSIEYLFEWMQEQRTIDASESLKLLNAIAKINSDTAVSIYISQLAQLDTIPNEDFPTYYANKIFEAYRDSLELTKVHFDQLLALLETENSAFIFYNIIESIIEDGERDHLFIAKYEKELLAQVERDFVRFDSLVQDSVVISFLAEIDKGKVGYDYDNYWENLNVEEQDVVYNYFNVKDKIKELAELLLLIGVQDVGNLIDRLSKSNDPSLQLLAFNISVEQGLKLKGSVLEVLLSDDELGFVVISSLFDKERLDLLPEEIKTKEKISEFCVKNFVINESYSTVKDVNIIEVRKQSVGDKKGLIYIYEVVYLDRKGRYIVVSGLQSTKKKINYSPVVYGLDRQYLGQDLDEIVDVILKGYDEKDDDWESEYKIEF